MGQGMGRLERGDDAFELAQELEGGERVIVPRANVEIMAG